MKVATSAIRREEETSLIFFIYGVIKTGLKRGGGGKRGPILHVLDCKVREDERERGEGGEEPMHCDSSCAEASETPHNELSASVVRVNTSTLAN